MSNLKIQRSPIILSTAFCLIFIVLLSIVLAGCGFANPIRSKGQFPNIPALMDVPTTELQSDSSRYNIGYENTSDLNGWDGYKDVIIDAGEDRIILNCETGYLSSTFYYLFSNGRVYEDDPWTGTYVANLLNETYELKDTFEIGLDNVWENAGKEQIYSLLKECGIDASNISNVQEYYAEGTPFEVIYKIINGQLTADVGFAGTVYELTGETKTVSGRTLYINASLTNTKMINKVAATTIGRNYFPSYYCIDPATADLCIVFALDEPPSLATDYYEMYGMSDVTSSIAGKTAEPEVSSSSLNTYDLTTSTENGESLSGIVLRDSSNNVIPDSSTREYSIEELEAMNLNPAELCIAWNEPFARMGYNFGNSDILAYFESTGWYQNSGQKMNLDGIAARNVNRLQEIAAKSAEASKWRDIIIDRN